MAGAAEAAGLRATSMAKGISEIAGEASGVRGRQGDDLPGAQGAHLRRVRRDD